MIRRDGLKIIKWNIFQNYFSLLTRNHWQSQRWEDWQETEEFSWRLWSPHSLSPAPSLVQRDPWSYTRDEDDDDVVIYLCSHSQTPCQVPSVTLPSQIGSVKLDPSRHACNVADTTSIWYFLALNYLTVICERLQPAISYIGRPKR